MDPVRAENSESEDVTVFQIQEDHAEPRFKALRTRLLTYVRQNYLFLIKILLCVILFLLLTIILILSLPVTKVSSPLNNNTVSVRRSEISLNGDSNATVVLEYSSSLDANILARIKAMVKQQLANEDLTSTIPSKVDIEVVPTQTIPSKVDVEAVPCGRINCDTAKNICKPTNTDYKTVKVYVCCCKVSPLNQLRFERYGKDSDGLVSLFFQSDNVDVSKMSNLDLKYYPKLYYNGHWKRTQESDTVYNLKYEISNSPPNDQPDEFD